MTDIFLRRSLILDKFQIYKILRIQINVIEKKEKNVQNRNHVFIFPSAYATMKQKVTLRLFPGFKGAYPDLQPETNFKISHAIFISIFISNTSSTVF